MRKTFGITVGILFVAMIAAGARAQTQTQQPPQSQTSKAPAAPSPASPPAPTLQSQSASPFKTDNEKASYALGLNIGSNLKRQSVDVDPAILAEGLKDGLTGAKPLLTEDEAKAALTQLQTEVRAKQEAARKAVGDANMKAGTEFLASNKTKEGVVALPSGLQYKILAQGNGPKPTASDTVVCNYRGTLIDGTEFDSSYKRGQPATFPVGRVIKGWTEALQLMPVGSKWQLFIPPDLAYGANGAGSVIGPNATLIFEVELMSIKPAATPPAPGTPAAPAQQPPTH
jgi:FKBP-type peptidyl-prolyl cis-trans isomerase FklB